MLFNYRIGLALALAYTSAVVGAKPYIAADRALQHLNPRAEYQGGWPLALSALNTTCPAEASVQCSNGDVNPSCCPAGQTCVWGGGVFAFYCCPTGMSLAVPRHPLILDPPLYLDLKHQSLTTNF